MMPTLALVMIAYNEQEYLSLSKDLFFDKFDQLVFVDMGSNDGSLDVIASCPADRTTLVQIERRALFDFGFAHARNIGTRHVHCDWVFSVDADEIVVPSDFDVLRERLQGTGAVACAVDRRNYHRWPDLTLADWPDIVADVTFHPEAHRRLFRPTSPVHWRGTIHEELWCGDATAPVAQEHIPITLHHLSAYRTEPRDHEKGGMYAWLTLRAFCQPAFRDGTNGWWFDTYVPEHHVALCGMANEFAAVHGLEGFTTDRVEEMIASQGAPA